MIDSGRTRQWKQPRRVVASLRPQRALQEVCQRRPGRPEASRVGCGKRCRLPLPEGKEDVDHLPSKAGQATQIKGSLEEKRKVQSAAGGHPQLTHCKRCWRRLGGTKFSVRESKDADEIQAPAELKVFVPFFSVSNHPFSRPAEVSKRSQQYRMRFSKRNHQTDDV